MKNRGSVLQIVLVIWCFIITVIGSILNTNQKRASLYHNISLMMKQKNVEIMLVSYYIETMKNDFLLSDSFTGENYMIEYYIDDMWSYYVIDTYVEFDDIKYGFTCKINTDDFCLTYFEYL